MEMTEPLYDSPPLSVEGLGDLGFIQNLPSILTSHVLDPQPGETVLDMCTSPGTCVCGSDSTPQIIRPPIHTKLPCDLITGWSGYSRKCSVCPAVCGGGDDVAFDMWTGGPSAKLPSTPALACVVVHHCEPVLIPGGSKTSNICNRSTNTSDTKDIIYYVPDTSYII